MGRGKAGSLQKPCWGLSEGPDVPGETVLRWVQVQLALCFFLSCQGKLAQRHYFWLNELGPK